MPLLFGDPRMISKIEEIMKKESIQFNLFFVLFLSFSIGLQGQKKHKDIEKDFFPFSVWYSGGKARAPMLSAITPRSTDEWTTDLKQIKDLGFNTVRTWVEWAACEPEPGRYNFDNLHLLMRMANEVGLKVFIQIYVDSARTGLPTITHTHCSRHRVDIKYIRNQLPEPVWTTKR